MSTYKVEQRKTEARGFVGVRRTAVPIAEIGKTCAEILPATYRWLSERGVVPASAPIVLYFAHQETTNSFDLLPGFFVSSPIEGDGQFESGWLEACDAAVTLHRGPYETIGKAHDAACDYVRGLGRRQAWPSWEIYLTDPGAEPDSAKWETEVGYPMQ